MGTSTREKTRVRLKDGADYDLVGLNNEWEEGRAELTCSQTKEVQAVSELQATIAQKGEG